MAIGITPQALNAQGIQDQGIQQAPMPAQGVQDTAQQAAAPELPQTWFKQDLENPYILPWGEFNVDPNFNFQAALNNYHVEPPKPMNYANIFGGMGRMNGNNLGNMSWKGGAQDLFYSPIKTQTGKRTFETTYGLPALPQGQNIMGHNFMTMADRKRQEQATAQLLSSYTGRTNAISFKDAKIDAAINALNSKAYSLLAPKQERVDRYNPYSMFGNWQPRRKEEPKIILDNSTGWSPLARLADAKKRDAIFAEAAAELGMKPEDLQFHYGKYDKAYRSLHDPVGANWQDLKQSPVYDKLIGDIRDYAQENSKGGKKNRSTGFSDGYFDSINAQAGDFRTNPNYLPAEYFALHAPNQLYPGRGGKDGTGAVKGKGYSAIANHDPYRLQDWTDYADQNKAWWQLTPEEKALAEQGMGKHNEMLKAPYDKGGPFDLVEAGDLKLPKLKGYKEYWQYSPKMGELNVAQNALGWNTQGKRNFEDAGFDANAAYKDSLYLKKKKKKKGGLGGMLGTALSLASFAFPQFSLPLKLASGALSIANGNPLGGLMSVAGGLGAFDGITGSISNAVNGVLPTGASALGNVGDMVSSGVMGGLGALAGKGDPLTGALLGAGASGIGQNLVNNAGWSVPAAQLATGIGKGALGQTLAYNKAKKAATKQIRRA